ncbi:MAG TPA: CvpA family protein [Pedobacter sp.]
MNYVDVLLCVLVILFTWIGTQKGFILGVIDLTCWLGGLILTFLVYHYVASFFDKYLLPANTWNILIGFLISLIFIRVILSYFAQLALKRIPLQAHKKTVNKAFGIFPGFINGIIYAMIATLLISFIPLSEGMSNEAEKSKIVASLSRGIEYAETKFDPVLHDVNRSLTNVIRKPHTEKTIKLPFTIKNAKPRPDLEAKMLVLVNKERHAAGLKPLKADPEITPVARKHSNDMFSRSYFSHISPEGATPFDRLKEGKITFRAAGENLALAQTLSLAHTGLMNSPGHRANILHKSFGRVGIGILDGNIYGIMVTQNFRD